MPRTLQTTLRLSRARWQTRRTILFASLCRARTIQQIRLGSHGLRHMIRMILPELHARQRTRRTIRCQLALRPMRTIRTIRFVIPGQQRTHRTIQSDSHVQPRTIQTILFASLDRPHTIRTILFASPDLPHTIQTIRCQPCQLRRKPATGRHCWSWRMIHR
jgi:hypothetical protein